MIEVIGNEMYRIHTTLENAIGREPNERDISRFEVLAQEALNNVVKQMVTEAIPVAKVPAEPPTDNFNMYAFVRPDIVQDDELPPVTNLDRDEEHYLPEDLVTTMFPCYQPDELDNEEYNMLIILPDGKTYSAKSIDFDFTPIPEKTKFSVDVVRTGYSNRSIEVFARTQEEANDLALNNAGNYAFHENNSEYELM